MKYENLYQSKSDGCIWKDMYYGFEFYHDFSRFKSLESQYSTVIEKYKRRIKNFLSAIEKPCVFIRYINTEDDDKELKYFEENYNHIIEIIKSFNNKNVLILVSNDDVQSDFLEIYRVEKDVNDTVAREFVAKNSSLYNVLCELAFPDEIRKRNLERYKKRNKKRMFYYLPQKRIMCCIEQLLIHMGLEYIHPQQY